MEWKIEAKSRNRAESFVESLFLKKAGRFLLELARQLEEQNKKLLATEKKKERKSKT